jgi:glycerophosphoryl diester phosphodiesterase
MPTKPYFTTTRPHILAHRGLHTRFPENTLAAFDAALTAGATHLETDAHTSRDGVAVLVHDPVVVVDGVSIPVMSLTAAELGAVDLGEGQGVPTLSAALERFPEARFNIDIKVTTAGLPAATTITQAHAAQRVLIASFKAARRTSAYRRIPGACTSASGRLSLFVVLCSRLGLTRLGASALRSVDAVQLPTRILGMRVFTPRFIRMCHTAGVVVHAWTINDEPTMRELLGLGVDGLVTDRADLAAQVSRELNA